MKISNKSKLITIISVFILSAQTVFAKYTVLEKVPGIKNADFLSYVTGFYNFAIAFVLIAALLMITIGGFYYITAAGNQAQAGTAKKIITDALLGLVVVFLIWLILYTINPDLLKANPNLSALQGGVTATSVTQSNNQPPDNGGQQGSCEGVTTTGINPEQCKDTSENLAKILKCLNQNYSGLKVTSITDDDAVTSLANCQGSSYKRPPCDHKRGSCHYGGRDEKSESYAVDISTRSQNLPNNMTAQDVINAAIDCGATNALDEPNTHHVHVNAPGC